MPLCGCRESNANTFRGTNVDTGTTNVYFGGGGLTKDLQLCGCKDDLLACKGLFKYSSLQATLLKWSDHKELNVVMIFAT